MSSTSTPRKKEESEGTLDGISPQKTESPPQMVPTISPEADSNRAVPNINNISSKI